MSGIGFRLFHVASDGDLTLDSVSVLNGNIIGDGRTIYNRGSLTLLSSEVVFWHSQWEWRGACQRRH